MEKKQNMLMFFKRVGKKGSWRSRFGSSGFRWKKRCSIYHWFVDRFIFKIVSVFEAIALVSTLCFFFLCCGCNF